MLRDKQLLPVVCFVFSRKRCDDYLELVKGLDLNSQEDKHYVSQFFRQALSRLNESDRQLQQVIEFQIYDFFLFIFGEIRLLTCKKWLNEVLLYIIVVFYRYYVNQSNYYFKLVELKFYLLQKHLRVILIALFLLH